MLGGVGGAPEQSGPLSRFALLFAILRDGLVTYVRPDSV